MTSENEDPYQTFVTVLTWRLARGGEPMVPEWPEGELPEEASCILFTDGLATSSQDFGFSKHWLYRVRDLNLTTYQAFGVTRGFSYRGKRLHYSGRDTNILLQESPEKIEPYLPSNQTAIRYLSNSFGAVVTCIGLGAWLRTSRATAFARHISHLFLVQPTFAFRPAAIQAFAAYKKALPAPLVRMKNKPEEFSAEIVKAIQSVAAAHIGVYILFWPNDLIIDYAAPIFPELERIPGVVLKPLNLTFPKDVDNSFQRHCLVASQRRTLDTIAELLIT